MNENININEAAEVTISFADLKLIEPLQKALKDLKYNTPTPIQAQAIPILLDQKDLLGCAQTGTGKTAAFALPLLNNLMLKKVKAGPKQALILILTPTRELAVQIHQSFLDYGKYLDLKYAVIYGGVGQVPQVRDMARGVDVLIATPGRLFDLLSQKHIFLDRVHSFVLDEADRMLDMGFINDIQKVIKILPKQRHNLFFSATMPTDILKLASTILKDPVHIEVTPESTTAEKIEQWLMYVDHSKKRDLLQFLLQDKALKRVIVFTRTKHGANRVAEILQKSKITSEAIHGNKSQNARQRALDNFKSGHVRVLIATDIAARGIDVDGITHVINYEIPNIPESYVHRIGRTARAGAEGIAISFCEAEEKSFIRDIEKIIGRPIPVTREHPYHSPVIEEARIVSSGKAKAQLEARNNRGGRNNSRRGPKGGSGGFKKRFMGKGSGPKSGGSGPRPHNASKTGSKS